MSVHLTFPLTEMYGKYEDYPFPLENGLNSVIFSVTAFSIYTHGKWEMG